VEIDPLEALVEISATKTYIAAQISATEFWNGADWKSPYLIVVLISCINIAIDTLECNQRIPHCNNFYKVAMIMKK
jgi:hypothetical protein